MEAILLFIIKAGLFVAAISFSLYLWAAPRERRAREEEERKQQEQDEQIKAFAATHMRGWDYTPAKLNGDHGFIAMSDDGLSIRYATYKREENGISPLLEKNFEVSSILSFDIVTPDTTKTITHHDKVPVATKQKRSTVGRAVVGGVLLGPVGAAVGAASGLNGKDKIEYRRVERQETVVVKGDPLLVLGLKDINMPRLKIQFDPPRFADDWWYRIQSAKV